MLAETFGLDGAIIIVLVAVVGLALTLWALIDACTRPAAAFRAAGQNKTLWIILPIIGFFLFSIVGAVLGLVYLLAIRPKVAAVQAVS
jgi:hypothetical protein